uniref:Cytochrome c biogenesis protein CcsB n=1 Tax=Bornetia secundiflora TaxID=2575637 RepID=A0A4D6WR33_9FLOR|nr:cytochrome c biogenesis protein ccs1 [Bornetia secundiflora]
MNIKFFNFKNILWNLLKKIANLNFAISILFVIIIFSIIGSVIEQDQNLVFYQFNYPLNNTNIFYINWQVIIFWGLDHIYRSWWFILTLFIFALSLIVCTFSIQLPTLKNARRWKFITHKVSDEASKIYHYDVSSSLLYQSSLVNMVYSLNIYDFQIFHKKCKIYAYKGIVGKIAPIFVHVSIITTLMGIVISIFSGFMSQEMIARGELFHIKNLVTAGPLSNIDPNIIGQVDDFFIDYNLDDSIKQFFSKLSILDNNGRVLITKTISVNSPLVFRHLTFYQTDWRIDALRIQMGTKQIIQKQVRKIDINSKTCWLCNFSLPNRKQYFVILFNLKNKISIYDVDQDLIYATNINESINLNGIPIIIKDVLVSTGLQVKTDPGVFIIYLGFFVIMISTALSYVSYTQIWVYLGINTLQLTGSTNRAVLLFEEDMNKVNNIYRQYML